MWIQFRNLRDDHSVAGFAYRSDDEFTFSGGTEVSESVVRFTDGSCVLIHDCAYYDEEETNHATPHQLGQAIADVDIDELYLNPLLSGCGRQR